ncbi:MAG: Ig-like domain-containing protein [Verrucomicrobiae bacterium]|nr:Ig-like domain-containing protein [Verrucomicrobiae bacterium]
MPSILMTHFSRTVAVLAVVLFGSVPLSAIPQKLGDLDEDGVATVADLSLLTRHIEGLKPLSQVLIAFADLNQDNAINDLDQDELVQEILQSRTPRNLPLLHIIRMSPEPGEGDVAVTRETILEFSVPLALDATLGPDQVAAVFAGRPILSRVEISSDRRKATLFYLQNLPSSARIQIIVNAPGLKDLLGRNADLDGDGVAGGAFTATFDTLTLTPLPNTAITGTVYASETNGGADVPLSGVTITVDGAEETLRAVTNAAGKFTLSPCPAGKFFVTIDGRTSSKSNFPGGDYYPYVGKKWEALAGRTDNQSGESTDVQRGKIYLPLIKAGSLNAVSATETTVVEFPESVLEAQPGLQGVQVIVPPNALFSNDGTRVGSIGIAPVPSDRLPSPLPLGLDIPLVITIQTDGPTNFDRPVPVCFPNLPDATGVKLAPGEKTALWSFNHDSGKWEPSGPMTVTADGNFVKSDAGTGVWQPGWHGPNPGTPGAGGPPVGPPADPDGPDPGDPPTPPQPGPPPPPLPPDGPPNPPPPCKDNPALVYIVVYDAGKEAMLCAAEFTKVRDGIQCAIGILGAFSEVTSYAAKLTQFQTSPVPNVQAAKDLLDLVVALTGRVDNLIACFETLDPSGKAKAIVQCLKAILATVDGLCQIINDNTQPPECQGGVIEKKVCEGVGHTRNLLGTAEALVGEADGLKKKVISSGIKATLTLTQTALQAIINRANGPEAFGARETRDGDAEVTIILTDEEKLQLQEASELLLAGAEAFNSGVNAYPELQRLNEQLGAAVSAIFSGASDSITRIGTPQPGTLFYAIEYDGQTVRGKTGDSGAIEAILPPNTYVSVKVWQPSSSQYAATPALTAGPGQPSRLNMPFFEGPDDWRPDADGDKLPDVAEFVVGTNPNARDTDGDGIGDNDELVQGSDPLDGQPAQTGVIAAAPTSGPALDVAAFDDTLVVAEGGYGFEVFRTQPGGRQPVRIAAYPHTNNLASSAAVNNVYAAIAASTGVIYVPVSQSGIPGVQPSRIPVGGVATAIALEATTAFVGTSEGQIVEVDLSAGSVIERINLGSSIEDIVITNGVLYAYRKGWAVSAIPLNARPLAVSRNLDLSGGTYAIRRYRLTAAGNVLYAQHVRGWHIIDIASPLQPALVENVVTPQFGWRHVVANGSGLGIVVTGPNASDDAPHDVGVYRLGADGKSHDLISMFGLDLHGESLAIHNGQAYLAAGSRGLLVVNYRAFEQTGTPPTIALTGSVNLAAGAVEEGKVLRLSAAVTDDVQVRSVDFIVDGVRLGTDGSFPFEFAILTPPRIPGKTSIAVQAVARDTSGKSSASPIFTLNLTPDATPPFVVATMPARDELVAAAPVVFLSFSETMDAATLVSANVFVTSAGADGILGTADDGLPAQGTFVRSESAYYISFATPLPAGKCRVTVQAPAADAAGNPIADTFTSDFRIASKIDTDRDGIPDDWESVYGFDAAKADSNNNGTPDGLEDLDGDTLGTALEIQLGFHPQKADSNVNGIRDDQEDTDFDGLSDVAELIAGTNVLDPDSDDDTLNDEVEVASGTDPLNLLSVPWTLPGATISFGVDPFLKLELQPGSFVYGGVPIAQHIHTLRLNTAGAEFPIGSVRSVQGEMNLHRLDDPTTKQLPFGTPVSLPPVKINTGQP